MRNRTAFKAPVAAIVALSAASLAVAAETPAGSARDGPRLRAFAELGAGPLLGLDRPLRGASAEGLVGLRLSPFEAGLRAAGAYDAGFGVWDARFDFLLGLGGGLRAIVGGLLLPGKPGLEDSSGREAAVRATPADWPNRFGIGATIASLLPGASKSGRGPAASLDAELVYASYRVEADDALSGAAAFAAGVEARIALILRWGARDSRP